ncbi:MAG: glycoside hydrolase family 9 protein [Coleofasciculaceae cyanobacterium]
MLRKRNTAKFIIVFLIAFLIFSFNYLSYLTCQYSNLFEQSSWAQTKYNYGEVLQKAIYFYETQRSGNLPKNNRVEWRGDSALKDGSDNGIDLTGGWYDAGDHMKFGLPMAASATLLAWGGIEYKDAYQQSGQYKYLLDNLRWVNDYFIKAHPSPNLLWGQVGIASLDHAWWGPAEVMPMERPSYKIDTSCPGSDLAGETASAMAASSILFQETDANYAKTLLIHAQELYEFADKYRGEYSDCITEASDFYPSQSGYYDELVWSAIWLYQATGEQKYLDKAEQNYDKMADSPNSTKSYNWTHTWDDKSYGSYVLLAKLTGKEQYIEDAERWLDYWSEKCKRDKVYYTPGGLAWLDEWGSLRYTAKTAFLAFIYGDWVEDNQKKSRYHSFAERQINYMLGSNPQQISYVVGFGNNFPSQPHHRTAHGSWANNKSIPEKSRHILYGALVGGPDKHDNYLDERSNFKMTEVATDYNAGFTGAVAKMYSKHGGEPLANFPKPETKEAEFFVEAQAEEIEENLTQVKAVIYNQSAWPARIIKNLSFRYFLDLSEVIEQGYQASDLQVNWQDNQGASISDLKAWNSSPSIYYVQVNLDGSQIYPGGEQYYKKAVQFSFTSPTPAWNLENDWSYSEISNQNDLVKTEKIPVYDKETLIFGAEPKN